MSSRYIPEATKLQVLERQKNRCNNNPIKPALNLNDYHCPIWQLYGGEFDQAGWQFDHIDELAMTHNNDASNIQALCPSCHAVKTKRFMENKRQFTSSELDTGRGFMDIDKGAGAKRKYKTKSTSTSTSTSLSVTPQPKKRRTKSPKASSLATKMCGFQLTPEFLARIYKKT
jgi:hypothetical protein